MPGRRGTAEPSLIDELARRLDRRLWVVHRLDRGTSGLLLVATDAATHRALCQAFAARRITKRYLAVVHGALPASGTIRQPLHSARRGKMRPARPDEPGAVSAETTYRRLAGDERASLVELRPATGRRHQLRVHLRWLGHPVLGDDLYGRGWTMPEEIALDRLALHAAELAFDEPRHGEPRQLRAPLPPELRSVIERLGLSSAG